MYVPSHFEECYFCLSVVLVLVLRISFDGGGHNNSLSAKSIPSSQFSLVVTHWIANSETSVSNFELVGNRFQHISTET